SSAIHPLATCRAVFPLSLHDALPICAAFEQAAQKDTRGLELVHVLEDEDLHLSRPERYVRRTRVAVDRRCVAARKGQVVQADMKDRKSTRLNSSHQIISYAVFCLQKI